MKFNSLIPKLSVSNGISRADNYIKIITLYYLIFNKTEYF